MTASNQSIWWLRTWKEQTLLQCATAWWNKIAEWGHQTKTERCKSEAETCEENGQVDVGGGEAI